MTTFTHDTYLSPFTWRYGSPEMRALWSEARKRQLWRRIWVALAEAEQTAGLVTAEQVADLRRHVDEINLARTQEIEAEIHHDLMAEVRTYAEQCPVGGGIIHLGATSMDVEDNADALRIRDALDLLLDNLCRLLLAFADQIETWADAPTMAFTHLQPAEPTTEGYRLAQYAQDLLADYDELRRARDNVHGKGFKGAVGTSASYAQLLEGENSTSASALTSFESAIMSALDLEAFPVATQTYPRKQDYRVIAALAGLGASLYKFAFDLRVLQSPPIGEWAEPFGSRQVGSSAMPFKRNPIHAEAMDSLARYLAALPRVAWDNAAHNLLERTLDDSANRRSLLPEAFLITDELLRRGLRLIAGLRIDRDARERLLATYSPFAATERLLMELVKRGGDRQVLHEVIREHAMAAWAEVQAGRTNPLADALLADSRITLHASRDHLVAWLDAADYVGDAPTRARAFAAQIRQRLSEWLDGANRAMRSVDSFHTAYRKLEERMKALAEADGDVFLPNPEPEGPVQYVLICMEPSLGRWARSADQARSKVENGFRNFLFSVEVLILHFCIRRYLCGPAQRYHITDWSKGAMLVENASIERVQRYDRWYGLLQEEIDLVATPNAGIVAIGNVVSQQLERQGFRRPFIRVIHYSGQAGRARSAGIAGHEDSFQAFRGTVSLEDVIATAEDVLSSARVPAELRDEMLSRLARSELTTSRQQLIFNYKLAFESMRS
jgi:adenylosuccinate lyase